jgi:ribosomal protein L11 methyltransferase
VEVSAIDTDMTALANARENAKLNRVSGTIQFSTTPPDRLRGHFGLIAANILSSTLIRMAPDLKARLRHHGFLVLSGILQREAQAVANAYVPELSWVGSHNVRAWASLIFEK